MQLMNPVEKLLAIEEIKSLKARYFRLLHARNWTQWGDLFTRTGEFSFDDGDSGTQETSSEFVKAVRRLMDKTPHIHDAHMPEIEVTEPNRATGIWPISESLDYRNRCVQGHGEYVEEYEKGSDGTWKIRKLKLIRHRNITLITDSFDTLRTPVKNPFPRFGKENSPI